MKPQKKILVIDDIDDNLFLIRAILQKSHPEYAIILAKSGAEGIEIAQREFPDTILLDIFMPGLDGFETCKRLKSHELTSDIPILMVSAGGENTAVRIDGLKSGADAIISKPIKQEEFVAFVKVMLRIKEAEDRLKKRNRELELTEFELRESLRRISEYQDSLKQLNNERAISEEKERRRIAEYLHDGLGQNLSLVNLRLSALLNAALDPKTEKSIKETVDLVNIAINETRLLTYDLCPPILYELGLIPAISWKLSEIESKYQINTILEKITDESNISANKKILLYRVVTELLNNILKHTKADLIQVAISEIEDKFYISVIDNGAGFNDGGQGELTTKGSFGLFSIRERLDSIGGSLSIESEYFTGTKATIEIPL